MHMTSHAAALWSATPPPAPGAGRDGPTAAPATPPDPGPTVPVTRRGPRAGDRGHLLHHLQPGGPGWTALICDLPDGSRCYARLDEPVGAEVDLAGAAVTLEAGARGAATAHR